MQVAIAEMGAIYVSADVHDGWKIEAKKSKKTVIDHDQLPRIVFEPECEITGGHAFALVGYNEDGFIVQNSWGRSWGLEGFAVLSYEDWTEHGNDAWVCSLGVVRRVGQQRQEAARSRQIGVSMLSGAAKLTATPSNPAVQPWNDDTAYGHTIVAGAEGRVHISQPDIGSAAGMVDANVYQRIRDWMKADKNSRRKILIYAHGGLNSEEASIKRIRVLGPYFKANGIYPLFYTWRTGLIEILGSQLSSVFGPTPNEAFASGWISDAKDGLIELTAHACKRIWGEMKDNASDATASGNAIELIARSLKKLQAENADLEIHLLGHSAGAFVHGGMIDCLQQQSMAPSSLTLLAPACSIDYALEHYTKRVEEGMLAKNRFWLHVLSDQIERDDTAGPYGKSLLYLVDRGFEKVRKTPLAGLQRCLDGSISRVDDDLWLKDFWHNVKAWRAWVNSLPAQADDKPACEVITQSKINTGKDLIKAAHGSFDNNKEVIERSINRILGNRPDAPLAIPVEDLQY